MLKLLTSIFGSRNQRLLRQYGKFVVEANAVDARMAALPEPFAELFGLAPKGLVAQSLDGGLQLVGSADRPAIASNQPLIPAAENAR